MFWLMQGFKFVSKGVRRVIGRIRVSYGQRERLSTAFRGTGLGRRFKQNRSNRHQVWHLALFLLKPCCLVTKMLVCMDRQNKAETLLVKSSQTADACAFAAVHVGTCKIGYMQFKRITRSKAGILSPSHGPALVQPEHKRASVDHLHIAGRRV